MKKQIFFLALAALFLAPQALAQDKGFGVGAIAGDPFGFTGKYWINQTRAVDGAVAWRLDDNNSFQLHADYLFHDSQLLKTKNFALPAYVGIGPKFVFDDEDHNDDTSFGLRVPVGLSYPFKRDPIELFAEIAPGMDIAPNAEFDLNWGVGFRFYFK
jgi:hypothetical protein